ncbi:YdcH family protein [Stutzerimonas xanthomarina]|uniref:YdcH family protein n=1 Tax=Stutzerimonas xanthomarina TaxID=271420 RepID=UPI003AA8C1CC
MQVEHQALAKDFPEKQEQLLKLRQQNASFASKTDAYEALDQKIRSAEAGVVTLDDEALSALKQEQVTLKNDISRELKHASGSCCGGCGG